MRILIFGFSVTEAHGSYARQAKAQLDALGHSVDVCGMGGIHPDHAAYILPVVLKDHQYDIVVLEVMTSAYRNPKRMRSDYLWPLSYMVDTCQRAGSLPIMLALSRGDVDNSSDPFFDAANEVCVRAHVPLWDLRALLMPHMGDPTYMKDVVHPTEPGNLLQLHAFLGALDPYLMRSEGVDQSRCIWPALALYAQDLALLPRTDGEATTDRYARPGVVFPTLVNPARSPLRVSLPTTVNVNGVGFLMGPRTGQFEVSGASGEKWVIMAYDEYCYYERFHARLLPSMRTDQLTFVVSDVLPDHPLKKGTPDLGPREGKFCHAYISCRPVAEMISELRLQ